MPQSCSSCAYMTCVSVAATGNSAPPSSGPNVGAIAGGVVGGVALIATVTFLIWWFLIRPRKDLEEDEWEEEETTTDTKTQFREERDARASVHTVHSLASSMLSRASNMIPIAFIPGVTNRDGNTPPDPPIPAARNYRSSRGPGSDIFFSPGDLRNSAYSSTSTVANNRNTFLSISPSLARESIASDTYHDDAVANPLPAQHIIVARPNVVSVKSSPTVPTTDARPGLPRQLSSEAPRIQFAKPTKVTIGKKGGRFPVRQGSDASSSKPSIRSPLATATEESEDEEEPHARARQSLLRAGDDAPQSPFTDEAGSSRPETQYTNTTTLSAVLEEATWLAAQPSTHDGMGASPERTTSPFDDKHEVKEHE